MNSIQERPPLELVVFPKIRGGYLVPLHVWSPASCDQGDHFKVTVSENDIQRRINSKRLSDAELSAEVWHSIVKFYSKSPSDDAVQEACRNAVIERFATLPHHDEAPE